MPREITHFIVAQAVIESLEYQDFKSCIQDNHDHFLLGTIIFDSPYYTIRGDTPLNKLAGILHGVSNENTFDIFRFAIESQSDSRILNDKSTAFLLGMICHVSTDLTFHPFIYGMTGDYFASDKQERTQSIQDHRRLEVVMDMYFSDEVFDRNVYSISRFIKRLNGELEQLLKLFVQFGQKISVNVNTSSFVNSLKLFAWIQNITRTRKIGKKVLMLEPILPDYVKEVTALFYSARWREQVELIREQITYKDPDSGDGVHMSMDDLMNEAVADALRKIEEFREALAFEEKRREIVWPSL